MSVNKIVVEGWKVSFQEKSNDELYEIIRNEKQDDWFEEKKLAAETILKNRENIEKDKTNISLKFPSPDLGYVSVYGTARGLSSFIIGLGWIVAAIGVVIPIYGISFYDIASVAPWIGTIFGGLVMVMSGQITKATLDSADNTGRILHVFRKLSE